MSVSKNSTDLVLRLAGLSALILTLSPATALGVCATTDGGDSYTCGSGSTLSEVSAAYAAGNDPVAIYVDPGSYAWSGTLTLSMNKSIRLIGAAAPDAKTPGTSSVDGGWNVRMVTSGTTDKLYRIAGLDCTNVTGGSWLWIYAANAAGLSVSALRVDHMVFSGLDANGGFIYLGVMNPPNPTSVAGVIDHNVFNSAANSRVLVNDGVQANWTPDHAGTSANIFFEDNRLNNAEHTNNGNGCVDMNVGASTVIRYNTTQNCRFLAHGLYFGWNWGTLNFEIYGNSMTFDGGGYDEYRALHHQGTGEWYVFNNTVTPSGGKGTALQGQHYRDFYASPNLCDGNEARDGNRPGEDGYPCYHQPGRNADATLKPWYFWNNRWSDGAKISYSNYGGDGIAHVFADRDYYDEIGTGPQTSTSSPFDGSTGMGWGALANRPTRCTRTPNAPAYDANSAGGYYGGVAYFATDVGPQGTLFRCSDTDAWTVDYTPYTYPHPLTVNDPHAVCDDGTCAPACDDGICDAVEDCDSCPSDCGTCAPACDDGICDAAEDCASCPSDCGACAPTCDPATGEGCVLQGLVAHWEFDEGEGTTAADSSESAHTGHLHDASWTSGVWGGAGQFDGTASYVDVSSVKPQGKALTVALWMRADSFAVVDGRLISKATGVQTAQHDFMLSTASAGGGIRSRARLQTSSGATTLIGSGPDLEVDTWTHLALVYNGSELKLYQDGAEVGSTPMSGPISDTAPSTWIGRNPNGGPAFAGAIDDVRMYDTALSAAQVEALINGTDSPPECVADTDCDDGDACTADSCAAGMCSSELIADCGGVDDEPWDGTCEIDEDCQDGDSCTYDVCNEGRCISAVISDCAEDGQIVVGCMQVGGGAWPGMLSVLALAFWRRRRGSRSNTEAVAGNQTHSRQSRFSLQGGRDSV